MWERATHLSESIRFYRSRKQKGKWRGKKMSKDSEEEDLTRQIDSMN